MQPAVVRITGVLHPDPDWLEWTAAMLSHEWGPVGRRSETFPFDHTDYYNSISPALFRTFLSFQGLVGAGGLADWKNFSCSAEKMSGESRKVNIDPGYVNGSRLVLASTKDHAHRIFLRDGIFAEVTLRYMKRRWVAFDCTFPDFSSGLYDGFLDDVRMDWLNLTSSTGGSWIP